MSGVYPAWKYHATKEAVVVNSEQEEKELGPGWADTPAAFEQETKKPKKAKAEKVEE